MSNRVVSLAVVLVGALCLSRSAASAAPLPSAPGESKAPVASPQERPDLLALEISSPNGKWYLHLGATDLGPARLHLRDDHFSAILVSTRLEGDRVLVTLGGEKGELEVSSIGRYEVRLGESAPVSIPELASLKAGGPWHLRVVPAVTATIAGCCSCGLANGMPNPEKGGGPVAAAGLNCCPNAGKCLGCGACGLCCG
ncbi:MAG: hypothetical protein M3O15_14770 [Acidobacteriota bacterium]|nr:hypothetical protein [Acidobacteriota bacterium]